MTEKFPAFMELILNNGEQKTYISKICDGLASDME